MVKKLILFVFCLVLASCSMQARKDQADVRDLFKQREYSQALKRLENSEIKKREENKLLYLLQRGKLLRAEKKHYLAAQTFGEAADLMDKLYTKSVKEALLTSVSNNNNETYYGSPYERSLLFYYQALSFLDIYQNGFILERVEEVVKNEKGDKEIKISYVQKKLSEQDRERYLYRSRAAIVAWDTFYKELQRSSRESTEFDHDLFAKILAAKVHELVGSRGDKQIALQLYKDAYDILNKTGLAFKSFTPDFEAYSKKLKGLEVKAIDKEKPIEKTAHFNRLSDFLKVKILSLSKGLQAWKYKSLVKKLDPSKEALAKVGEKKNVTILIEDGVVAPLVGEDFAYNLRSAIESVEDPAAKAFIAGIGLPVLTYFAMGPLGLGSVTTTGNTKLYARHGVGELMTAEAGIEFEMPVIKEPSIPEERKILIYKITETGEELAGTEPVVLAGPVSDLAYQMNLERASNAFSERGARIGIKHVLAIIAAYKTYQAVQKSSGELFAKPAAFAQYLVTAKGIKESERADTRQWSVLPSAVFIAELNLAPGDYIVKVASTGSEGKEPIKVGAFTVKAGREGIFSYIFP